METNRLQFYRFISFLIFLFSIKSSGFGQLVINEVCSKNDSVILDEYGESSDWIEIYNNGNTAINLEGYFLSDKEDNPTKWQFPNKTISPQSHLLIFASDLNLNNVYCHTNFKLNDTGETLLLSDALENEIDRLDIPALLVDISYGRKSDGSSEWTYFDAPTPESSNENGSAFEFAKSPTFKTSTYFCEAGTLIELECDDPNCNIRFTRDGSIPNENSELYTQPIPIDTTTTFRVVSFSDNLYPSKPSTRTYFVETNHTLPVIAVTSEPHNFWDYEEGIFEFGPYADSIFPYYGANFWKDVEIPLHVEFFKNHDFKMEFDIGGKIHGGKASRSKPMKALRLVTDGDFPTEGMDHQFFENKDIDNFRRLVLRNGSGDFNYTHFRDAYMHRYFIDEGFDLDVLAHQPIVVYVNGIYWGVMNLREKIDRFYINENYGIDKDSIDLLEEDLVVIEGSEEEYWMNYDFVTNNDLSIEANFKIAERYFDLSNITDYFIAQTYLNNTDFPNNNLKFWQPKHAGGKWRFLLFDLDVGMGRHGWTKAHYNNFQGRMENADENKFTYTLLAFLENETFKNYFINRYADLMNTSFRSENLKAETERTVAEIDEEMKAHFQKWTWPGYDVWQEDRLAGLYTFVEERPVNQREFVRQYFELENEVELTLNTFPENAGTIRINTVSPESLPWNGYYYNGVPVTLTVIPNSGFTFKGWQSIHTINQEESNETITYNFETDDEIVAYFEANYEGLDLKVSPNPFESELKIDYTLDQISEVEVIIYDSVGKLIQSFNLGKKNAGKRSTSLTINNLHQGIYFLHLKTENEFQSIKLIR